jgi:23S rRNA (adenine2503-C2)-methyltransferase
MWIDNVVVDQVENTRKFRMGREGGIFVETVYFENRKGRTGFCLSTQAGCDMGCRFCATGLQKNKYNLTAEEIVEQVSLVQEAIGNSEMKLDFITLAGMGEPLANYANVMDALDELQSKVPINILSLSTVGLTQQIERMIDQKRKYRVYISLHSARQAIREEIMPMAKYHPVRKLIDVASEYAAINDPGQMRISYLLLKDVNDSDEDFKALVNLIGDKKFPVQVLLWNKVNGTDFERISENTAEEWVERLQKEGVDAYSMPSSGRSINAACGQLTSQ